MSDTVKQHKIRVCQGPTCGSMFARDIMKKCEQEYGNRQDIDLDYCGCLGHCSLSNNVQIDDEAVISRNNPENALENIAKALSGDIYAAGGGVSVDPFNLEDDKFLGI